MSHPRAIIPPSALAHYRQHGGKATARAYGHSWETLRRWLIEHGEQIRPQGVRISRKGERGMSHALTPDEVAAIVTSPLLTTVCVAHPHPELFRWASFQEWVNHAARDFRRARAGGDLPHEGGFLCIDAAGYVCEIGKHFMAARDAGRFPVRVLRLAEG